MVGRADTSHLVAAEEQRVLPLVCQGPDAPFRQAVVYGIVPVLPVQEHLVPEIVEISDRLLHQASAPRGVSGFHQVEQAPHSYYYFRCFGRVPQASYVFLTELHLNVSLLQGVELSDVFEELTGVHVVLYLGGILELRPHVGHAADVVYIEHLVVQVQVHIVPVGLQRTELPAFQNVPQHLAASTLRPREPSS